MIQWFLTRDGETVAQFTTEEFKDAVARGRIRRTDYIRRSDSSTFISADEFLPATYQPKSGAAAYAASLFAAVGFVGLVLYTVVMPSVAKLGTIDLAKLQAPASEPAAAEDNHDAIRQALMSDTSENGAFQLLAGKDPAAFEELVAHVASVSDGETDTISVARQYLMKTIIEPRAKFLSDDDKVASMTLTRDISAHLATGNPELCIATAVGKPAGDVRPFLTPALADRERELMAKMLDTSPREIELLPAETLQELNKKVAVALYAAHADQIALLDLENVPPGQEAAACQMFVAYLDGVLGLPRDESVALIRAMMTDPSKLSRETPAAPAPAAAETPPSSEQEAVAAQEPAPQEAPTADAADPPAAEPAAPAAGDAEPSDIPFPEGANTPVR